MKKTVIPIKGMHCRSCEILIEDELKKINLVKKVSVSQKRSEAIIWTEAEVISGEAIGMAVKKAGYQIGTKEELPFFSKDSQDYAEIFLASVLVVLLYFTLDILGLTKVFSATTAQTSGLLSILLIGLTAGISTCMALVGGLVLGVASRFAESQPNLSNLKKFQPHLLFNAGRIGFFFIFGGLIGSLGSILQLSGTSLGVMTLLVALVMFLLGLQLTGLFPRLSNFNLTLPKGIARSLGIDERKNKQYSHRNALILGGLTFFLPCGFTQAVQLMAVTSGSFWKGATMMSVFALGTAPGLLGIGGLTSVIKGESAKKFFKFVGVAVIFMSIFNLRNGTNLLGTSLGISAGKASTSNLSGNINNGVQVIRMEQTFSGYSPNSFTLKKDLPVKWIINSTAPNSCAASLMVPKLNIRKLLSGGENIIEFTPKEVGKIGFSCSMGMFTGEFNVVDDNGVSAQTNSSDTANSNLPVAAKSSGGGCGCGGSRAVPTVNPQNVVQPARDGNVQVIKTVYTQEKDISPSQFSLKANLPARMEIEVKDDGFGCMGTIAIPQLTTDVQPLIKGKTIIFNFTPQKPGEYPITCAMGVPRGVIKVI